MESVSRATVRVCKLCTQEADKRRTVATQHLSKAGGTPVRVVVAEEQPIEAAVAGSLDREERRQEARVAAVVAPEDEMEAGRDVMS